MSNHDNENENADLGTHKRDFVGLYRAIILVCSLFAGGASCVVLYAGDKYVRTAAQTEVADAMRDHVQPIRAKLDPLPPRIDALEMLSRERSETLKEYATWRNSKDTTDARLISITENLAQMLERQQKQIDRQQNLLDEFARIRRNQ